MLKHKPIELKNLVTGLLNFNKRVESEDITQPLSDSGQLSITPSTSIPKLPSEVGEYYPIKGVNYEFLEEEYHRVIADAFKLAAKNGWMPSMVQRRPTKRVRTGVMKITHQPGDELFIDISFKPW